MIEQVKVPSAGESVTESVLAVWSVPDGAAVSKGDTICELETDKASMEVPATSSGVIRHRAKEGDAVLVGSVLAEIDTDGAASAGAGKEAAPPAAKEAAKGQVKMPSGPPDPPERESRKSPADIAAAKTGVAGETSPSAAEAPKGGGPTVPSYGSPAPSPAETSEPAKTSSPGEPHRVTSVARKMAEEYGLDISKVRGSGAGGLVTREDVLLEADRQGRLRGGVAPSAGGTAQEAPESRPASTGGVRRERMSSLRRTVARRLVEAQHTAAILTTFNDVDMSAIMELRKRYKDAFKERHNVGLGFMSFFVKACVSALQAYPRVNAQIDGNDIVYNDAVHVAVAVSTEKGLMVPVVRNVHDMSFAEIEQAILELAKRGRDGKIGVDDLQGGTFTISNGGVFGSMLSTPILNPPQSGILGMHRIEDRPVARDGQVVIRPMMYLALSYDHRIVDGKEAVGFLVRVKEAIEDPQRLLLDI